MVKFIHLQFTDIVGVVKGITIPSHELETALESGVWFDGSSIQGFARIAESDMYLMPDPETFRVIPWEGKEGAATARMICDVYTPSGDPFPGDPRGILKKAVKKAAKKTLKKKAVKKKAVKKTIRKTAKKSTRKSAAKKKPKKKAVKKTPKKTIKKPASKIKPKAVKKSGKKTSKRSSGKKKK